MAIYLTANDRGYINGFNNYSWDKCTSNAIYPDRTNPWQYQPELLITGEYSFNFTNTDFSYKYNGSPDIRMYVQLINTNNNIGTDAWNSFMNEIWNSGGNEISLYDICTDNNKPLLSLNLSDGNYFELLAKNRYGDRTEVTPAIVKKDSNDYANFYTTGNTQKGLVPSAYPKYISRVGAQKIYVGHFTSEDNPNIDCYCPFILSKKAELQFDIWVFGGIVLNEWALKLAPFITEEFDDEYGEISSSGGYGGGSFDDSSDAFGLPSLPSLGVSEVGFINVYNPSKGQLQGFADELFPDFEMPTPSTATGIEAVAENLANTFEVLGDFAESYVNAGLVNYVIDCHIVPVAPTTSGTAKIKVGFKSFNYTPAKVTSDYVEFDCGSLEIAEYYQNFLDYEGTRAKLYLPFVGFVDIKPEWFQSGKLGVTYHFNIIDGSCIAFVIATSSKSKLKNTVVATFGGNCCVHMPITGVNYSSMISGVVGGAVGIASNASNLIKTNQQDKGTLMSNIEGVAGIASNLGDAVSAKPSIEQSNGYNAGMSFMCYRRPYLLIERPVASFSKNYPKEQGLPLNVTKKLSSVTGFTTCDNVNLDGFSCTDEEKIMVVNALREGIIL